MPAVKKDPSARRRRNVASTASTLHEPTKVAIPDLPERAQGWHELTLAWWRDIWASPMAPEWHSSDVHGVCVLAAIYDDIWRGESAKDRKEAASEFRLARKDFGLTPYDRRRLEWTIEQAEESKDRGADRRRAQKSTSGKAKQGADPRSVLRAV